MELLKQLNDDMAASVAASQASLVRVMTGRGWRRGAGAGVIWSADGLLLTNAHVVRNTDQVGIVLPNREETTAQVIGLATNYDLALLKVDAHGLTPIAPGDSANLQTGEIVFASGHPWGVAGAATSGVVIGMGDDLPEMRRNGQEWIAVSLHYRPGHSGGPLVDSTGRLVGLNTMMAGPNVGLAVPVHIVEKFVNKVLEKVSVAV